MRVIGGLGAKDQAKRLGLAALAGPERLEQLVALVLGELVDDRHVDADAVFAAELGLTPAARARLATTATPPDDTMKVLMGDELVSGGWSIPPRRATSGTGLTLGTLFRGGSRPVADDKGYVEAHSTHVFG